MNTDRLKAEALSIIKEEVRSHLHAFRQTSLGRAVAHIGREVIKAQHEGREMTTDEFVDLLVGAMKENRSNNDGES